MVEARMGLPRRLAVAERLEQTLVVREDDAHAQSDAGEAATACLGFDCVDQSPRQTEAARRRQNREASEIEVALLLLNEHAAQHLAGPLRDDRPGAPAQFCGNTVGGLPEGAGFRDELAAILFKGGCDDGGDRGGITDRGLAQDWTVAHPLFLA